MSRAHPSRPCSWVSWSAVGALLLGSLALSVAGCGETHPSVDLLHAPTAAAAVSASQTIVLVAHTPITLSTLEHWVSVSAKIEDTSGKSKDKAPPVPPGYNACIAALQHANTKETSAQAKPKCESEYIALERKVLPFLISSDWVRAEAARTHVAVSHEETTERLEELKEKYYPKPSQLKHLLSSSGETMADLLWRIEGELLGSRLTEGVVKAKTRTTEEHVALKEYEEDLATRWKSQTNCSPGYVVEDCEQFSSPPVAKTPMQKAERREEKVYHEELNEKKEIEKEEAVNSKKLAKGETVKSNPSRGSSRQVRSNGETYNTLGGMNLTSPAFEVNGQIPVEYTCDGKGISPPIHWARVPSETKSLLLYVIDDTQGSFTDPNGGVRWMLANINPEIGGIAAGQVPEGAVVGKGNDGKTDYGPICPEKGKTDTIEFVMYAFKEKFNIKPGYTEQEVQEQYTANGNKMLSENATTYGVYTRP